MNDTTHNGWTNYETWRVNLEMFDGLSLIDFWEDDIANAEAYEVGQFMRDYAEDIITNGEIVTNSLAIDYALAFLSAVNWLELGQHKINESNENNFRR
jgi:hypothetical protein